MWKADLQAHVPSCSSFFFLAAFVSVPVIASPRAHRDAAFRLEIVEEVTGVRRTP